ncbi:MAG: hypothetical protein QM790_08225 [Nibricoccus sp.]
MNNQSPQAKILLHGAGVGGVTDKDILQRARELAAIDGDSSPEVSDTYIERARQELTGQSLPPTTGEDSEALGAMTRDPSEPISDSGHRVPETEVPDEQQDLERLTEEGVEEAQHEQMIAARRRERREDRQ